MASGGIGVDGSALVLETCAKTVAFGDGRDMFSLQPSGQLLNIPGGKCANVGGSEIKDGALVSLADCGSASRWEVQGNGQFKLKSSADLCLTQEGVAPGLRDVAANAAAMASSTVNAASHGGSCFPFVVLKKCIFCRSSDGGGRADENILGVQI